MSFIKTTPVNESQDAVRDMYARQQGAWGFVPNYAKSFSHRPEVMVRWGKLLAELKRPMDERMFELITFAAALELKNTGCSLAHGAKLAKLLGEEDVRAIALQYDTASITDAEREMMHFSRKVARDASAIEAIDVERLKRHGYDDADVFDIAAVAAGRAFLTKVLDAVGSLPDAAFLAVDEDLRVPLTVGRSIDSTAVEVMK